jgi:hypothetical protein
VWRHWPHRKQLSWSPRGCQLYQQQHQLSSLTESRMEPTESMVESATKTKLSR